MKMIFEFDPRVKAELQASLEEKIKEDIEGEEVNPCCDSMRVSVMPSDDRLRVGIKVTTRCACGKTRMYGRGADDASKMLWKKSSIKTT
jgi:hypothetical protein